MELNSGSVELTEISIETHRAISVHLSITAPLIVACSSDSWKAYKNMGETSMSLKFNFGQLNVAQLVFFKLLTTRNT